MFHMHCGYTQGVRSIQIRAVPDDVHASLRAKAASAGLSLSEYLLGEVTRIAGRPSLSEVLKRATERDWGVPPGRAAQAVRELRDDDQV